MLEMQPLHSTPSCLPALKPLALSLPLYALQACQALNARYVCQSSGFSRLPVYLVIHCSSLIMT
jgi:hypothetical protein